VIWDRMVERANRCYRWHDMVACTSVRGERRGCKKYVARIKSCKVRARAGEKSGKEMARPYTKLAPATKTGHQDAIALARSRNGSKEGKDKGVEGREMRFGESWGTFRKPRQEYSGFSKRLDRPENPLQLAPGFGVLNSRHQLPDAPSPALIAQKVAEQAP